MSGAAGPGSRRRAAIPLHAAALVAIAALAASFAPASFAQTPELMKRPRREERRRDYDVIHYRLRLELDVPRERYAGENAITLASLRDGLRTCVLDAADLRATGAVDASGAALPCRQRGGRLEVELRRAIAAGERTTFAVRFRRDGSKTGLKFVPAGPDHPAQVNTYGWPEDAHHWFPCADDPADKATSEVTAVVPSGWKALSNGRLVSWSENPAAGAAEFHWLQDKPHPVYNVMVAAGPYEILRDAAGTIPVDYWVYPSRAADAPRSFAKTPRMIAFFERTFGVPYPWAKYDQVCVAGYGGGMEATSATILGDDTLHDERADADFPSGGLVAHELAHQWWGDAVTERAWADVWLSESFATYADHLWTAFDGGGDEGALDLEEKKAAYLEEARTRYIRPIVFDRYEDPWQIMDGHSYPKGAAVLHMLRFELGDEAFFGALQRFLRAHAFGTARTRDFQDAVAETSGRTMDPFFDQWVHRPGHPVFEVSWSFNPAGRKASVRVRQVQDRSLGTPVFRTPVEIAVVGARGERVERVRIEDDDERFDFVCGERPLYVRFDHGNHLLKELRFRRAPAELLEQMRRDDAVGRTEAAEALAPFAGDDAVRAALRAAAAGDAFWAVRRSAVRSLGEAPANAPVRREETNEFLRGRLADPSSKVRAEALRGMASAAGPKDVPFFKSVFGRDPSYVVQAEALAAVGRAGGRGQADWIRKAGSDPSPHDILKASAEAALKILAGTAGGKDVP